MTDLILNIFIVRGFYFLVDFGYKETCIGPELELGWGRHEWILSHQFLIKHRLASVRLIFHVRSISY